MKTSHHYLQNYIDFQSNKESITKSVFSDAQHVQINNLHIFTIVFHFRQIPFLHFLLIHSFYTFYLLDHHLIKGLSLSSVHDSGILSLLIPKTRLLCQYSVPSSKHTFSNCVPSLGSFPSPLIVHLNFDSWYSYIYLFFDWHLVRLPAMPTLLKSSLV